MTVIEGGRWQYHRLEVTTQPNEPDQLMKELRFPRFSEKNPD